MVLLRKFIGRRLASYYGQSADAVVSGSSSPTIDPLFQFSYLLGEWHWKRQLNRLYQRQRGHWFTPVELFQPYYSNCVANFIAAHAPELRNSDVEDVCIDIVEFGGGRATNALAVLNHLQQHHADIYHRVKYFILDSSPTLHKLQQQRFQNTPHIGKISLVHKDLLDVAEGKTKLMTPSSKRSTFVIALELLDNLPHDKIKQELHQHGGSPFIDRLQQCHVVRQESSTQWEEKFVPLSDPLLRQLLLRNDASRSYIPAPGGSPIWIPTVAMGVLDQLVRHRPNAQVLLADFDWFPPFHDLLAMSSSFSFDETPPARLSQWAQQEPLIKSMQDEETSLDYDCYLTAPPLSDILFPTDFHKLSQFVKHSWVNAAVVVHKQADFLKLYGPNEVQQTTSWFTGFSPMIHDYSNTSVLTATFHPPPSNLDHAWQEREAKT